MEAIAQLVLESLVRAPAGKTPLAPKTMIEINLRFAELKQKNKDKYELHHIIENARGKITTVNQHLAGAEFTMLNFVNKFGTDEHRQHARAFVQYRNGARAVVHAWIKAANATMPSCCGCIVDKAKLKQELRQLATAFSRKNRTVSSADDVWCHISAVANVYPYAATLTPCACSIHAVAEVNAALRAENLQEDLAARVVGVVNTEAWRG